MCNWLKSLFGKKCNCEEKACCETKDCCEEKETATTAVPSPEVNTENKEEKEI